jgi:hypothetical protein
MGAKVPQPPPNPPAGGDAQKGYNGLPVQMEMIPKVDVQAGYNGPPVAESRGSNNPPPVAAVPKEVPPSPPPKE